MPAVWRVQGLLAVVFLASLPATGALLPQEQSWLRPLLAATRSIHFRFGTSAIF